MKKLVVVDQDACVACLACEVACSNAFYKEPILDLSCVYITQEDGLCGNEPHHRLSRFMERHTTFIFEKGRQNE